MQSSRASDVEISEGAGRDVVVDVGRGGRLEREQVQVDFSKRSSSIGARASFVICAAAKTRGDTTEF